MGSIVKLIRQWFQMMGYDGIVDYQWAVEQLSSMETSRITRVTIGIWCWLFAIVCAAELAVDAVTPSGWTWWLVAALGGVTALAGTVWVVGNWWLGPR